MCGGGGSSGGYQPPIDNSWQLVAQQEAAKKAADEAKARMDFDTEIRRLTEGGGARDIGERYFTSRGFNPGDYSSLIDSTINDRRSLIPDLDPNPASYFTSDLFAQAIDREQAANRTANVGRVQSTFSPGYERTLLPDDVLDDVINEIIGEQRGTAQTQLDYQGKRGTLTPTGTMAANRALQGQTEAARSTLTGLGNAELGKDRQSILDIIGNAGTAASNWMFGTPKFDVNPFVAQAGERAEAEKSSFGGDIRAALGDTNLFDIPSIIAAAGTAQGPRNLTTNEPAFGDTKKKATTRGLPTTGVF